MTTKRKWNVAVKNVGTLVFDGVWSAWKYGLANLLNVINRAHQGIVIGIPETEVLGVMCTGESWLRKF